MKLHWQHDKIWRAQSASVMALDDIEYCLSLLLLNGSPHTDSQDCCPKGHCLFIHVGHFQREVITFHKLSVVWVHSLLLEGIAKLEVIQFVLWHCKTTRDPSA